MPKKLIWDGSGLSIWCPWLLGRLLWAFVALSTTGLMVFAVDAFFPFAAAHNRGGGDWSLLPYGLNVSS